MARRVAAEDPTHPAAKTYATPSDEEALENVMEVFPEATVVETIHRNNT